MGFPEYDVTIVRQGARVLFELRNSAHEFLGAGSIPASWVGDVLDRGGRFNIMLESPPQERASAQVERRRDPLASAARRGAAPAGPGQGGVPACGVP